LGIGGRSHWEKGKAAGWGGSIAQVKMFDRVTNGAASQRKKKEKVGLRENQGEVRPSISSKRSIPAFGTSALVGGWGKRKTGKKCSNEGKKNEKVVRDPRAGRGEGNQREGVVKYTVKIRRYSKGVSGKNGREG